MFMNYSLNTYRWIHAASPHWQRSFRLFRDLLLLLSPRRLTEQPWVSIAGMKKTAGQNRADAVIIRFGDIRVKTLSQ